MPKNDEERLVEEIPEELVEEIVRLLSDAAIIATADPNSDFFAVLRDCAERAIDLISQAIENGGLKLAREDWRGKIVLEEGVDGMMLIKHIEIYGRDFSQDIVGQFELIALSPEGQEEKK